MALTQKQRLFVAEYLKNQNATQAYVRAYGVKGSTGKSAGNRMLTNVDIKKEIQKRMKKKIDRIELSGDKVIKEISRLAFAHLGLVCTQDEDTGNLKLKSIDEMEPGALAALESIQENKMHNKEGDIISTHTKFKMHDKIKCLELLCKYLGLLEGKGATKSDTKANQEKLSEALDSFKRKSI